MLKEFINNRKGQRVSVLVEVNEKKKGLVFVMHGLGGYKEKPHIEAIAKAFFEKGISVVRFDTTNSFGESDGKYEDATTTNYYEDLEDVIKWASNREWYKEPFFLVGHSLGSMCIMIYAEKYPKKVRAIAPLSCAINDNLKDKLYSNELKDWREKGYKESISPSGIVKRLNWTFMEDAAKHDPLLKADVLKMPCLLIVGSKDSSTPLEFQEKVKHAVAGRVELNVIEGAEHSFKKESELKELKLIIKGWLESLE